MYEVCFSYCSAILQFDLKINLPILHQKYKRTNKEKPKILKIKKKNYLLEHIVNREKYQKQTDSFLFCIQISDIEMIENQQMIICGFIGEREVGKTTLVSKYFRHQEITQYNPTIAVEVSYSSYVSDEGTVLRVKCWDTSGENKYKNMVCYHLKEAQIIVLMFDLTNSASFNKIDEWVARLKTEKANPKVLCLVGNKIDVVKINKNQRKVSINQFRDKAKQINAVYAEISAKNDDTFDFLDEAFQQILSERAVELISVQQQKTNRQIEINKMIQTNSINSACQCKIY